MSDGKAFAGRVVWVVGVGGIGRAAGQQLARNGAALGLTDVHPAAVAQAAEDLRGVAPAVAVAAADATSPELLASAHAAIVRELGPIDVLIHAAGKVDPVGIEACTPDRWARMLDLNLTSVYLAARLVLPAMRQARRGKIVSCSSVNGRDGGSELSGIGYAVAKGGLITLTRHLAKAYAAYNVQVNCVAPGPVATPMLDRLTEEERAGAVAAVPAGRLATAEEVAAAILYLASPEADFVTGVSLDINGGRHFS